MNEIIEILERLGQIEWYSIRPAEINSTSSDLDINGCFPIVSLRYLDGNELPFQAIENALNKFPNAHNWQLIGNHEKNITLAPKAIFDEDMIPSLTKSCELVNSNPDLATKTMNEFISLVQFIEKMLI